MPIRTSAAIDERLVALEHLDLASLARRLGERVEELVLERLKREGFRSLRPNQLLVLQLLMGEGRGVTELGELVGITQQASSKIVDALRRADLVEQVRADDARIRTIRLSHTGRHLVARVNSIRTELEQEMSRGHGARNAALVRRFLMSALAELGGMAAAEPRRSRTHG